MEGHDHSLDKNYESKNMTIQVQQKSSSEKEKEKSIQTRGRSLYSIKCRVGRNHPME